ncbi:MAG TPA: hypothetical protein VI942_01095 [Thermoanaerobaculia bacterium]|nr:hypothetical protein [Thermoanaerobaculia bacterium]
MTAREALHALVDRLPEGELEEAVRYLEYFEKHSGRSFADAVAEAPADDEPVTAEDLAALEEALADLRAGRVVSHEEARRRFLSEP